MRSQTLILIIVSSLILFATNSTAQSLWIWNNEVDLNNATSTNALIQFANAHDIDQIYLGVSKNYFEEDKLLLLRFLRQAQANAIKVYYLDGDPSWATDEGYSSLLIAIRRFQKFNSRYPDMFAGVHLDVEHGDAWFADGNAIAKEFLGNLKKLKARYPRLKLSLDIPFWLDSHPDASEFEFDGNFAKLNIHLRSYSEFLTIMDYRNYATNGVDGIIENAATEMQEGPTVIGLEFGNVQPTKITFYSTSSTYLSGELGLVQNYFSTNPNFLGFAFHSYNAMKNFYGE